MFCRTCGKEINDSAEFCLGCGCRPLIGKNYCQNCGTGTKEEQELCVGCGVILAKGRKKSSFNAIFEGDGTENYDFSPLPYYYKNEFEKMYNDEEYRGIFNWPAFLFGPLWLLYKALWLPGLLLFLFGTVLGTFTVFIGPIMVSILFGFRANYIYYNYYTKKQIRIN